MPTNASASRPVKIPVSVGMLPALVERLDAAVARGNFRSRSALIVHVLEQWLEQFERHGRGQDEH